MSFRKKRFNFQALGRLKQGEMNKTEAQYAQHLELLVRGHEILWYKFEAIKLRLAGKTFLTPDFTVINKEFQVEFHEVKGFMMEDANVKLKVAAETFPFTFKLVKKAKGNTWNITEI